MTAPAPPIIGVRLALPDDMRFVSASWFESYWKATMVQEMPEYASYKAGQDALIRRLVERSQVTVAFAKEVPDEILGYAVMEGEVLHYAYVKSVYRRHGICKGLIRSRAARYTHKTRLGEKVAETLELEFNPYLLF